jgi:hypothetical protein
MLSKICRVVGSPIFIFADAEQLDKGFDHVGLQHTTRTMPSQVKSHFTTGFMYVHIHNHWFPAPICLAESSTDFQNESLRNYRVLRDFNDEMICVARIRVDCSAEAIVLASMVVPPCTRMLMGAWSTSAASATKMTTVIEPSLIWRMSDSNASHYCRQSPAVFLACARVHEKSAVIVCEKHIFKAASSLNV